MENPVSAEASVSTASRPSSLKITDLRVACLTGAPFRSVLIRIDTNQGISGYGEVRDGGNREYALTLKSRLLGENPCDVDRLFRRIKQFGHHARQAGGVCGVEMALMDLAGKAYGVPAYMLAGGKFRDRVLCYCDTPSEEDGTEMGRRLKERMESGFGFLKMDIGLGNLRGKSDCVIAPPGMRQIHTIMHPFTGIQITEKGIGVLCEYVAAVRDVVGYEIPLAVDHFGHMGLESCIRVGKALDQFSLAWYEDLIPWQFADQYRRLSEAVDTPICTGEDIYLKEGFSDLFEQRAIAVVHPDLASSGGILETKKIGDAAQEAGIAMALHMAMSPVAAMASVHAAAATENFMVLENHSVDDMERWSSLVEGLPVPLIEDGHIAVPETPGLGFTGLNDDVVREFADPDAPEAFGPTDEWDRLTAHDRLWS
ncbi:MAG TPA: mandelate racemase/muconate lactonizing enzyme family protein [Candidatus Latescibacteria bacterium]|jgi:L-alanine-DL-glutamate epimerase-like enolase superfamily enzyme|nr:mandelate racemase [Gemmatimonadaceae bacterium]MDP6016699.1 mandelate racemase/muconate lactonizing enzyme family protein [Candidatus Latescibacterota bacterium]HJP32082.1 mandelate racemase/muconate lactonizing enzyme family protein [Candidatus Latescibacterota bacterium]